MRTWKTTLTRIRDYTQRTLTVGGPGNRLAQSFVGDELVGAAVERLLVGLGVADSGSDDGRHVVDVGERNHLFAVTCKIVVASHET